MAQVRLRGCCATGLCKKIWGISSILVHLLHRFLLSQSQFNTWCCFQLFLQLLVNLFYIHSFCTSAKLGCCAGNPFQHMC